MTLGDYVVPLVTGATSSIRRPIIKANNFEINPAILQWWLQQCNLVACHVMIQTTWDDLAKKFLAKFFPPAKIVKMRNDIITFVQFDMESLYEAWERYKELLRKCLHHGLPVWIQVQTFYNGLQPTIRTMIDAEVRGTLMKKSLEDAYELVKEMVTNNYQWLVDRVTQKRTQGVHEIDSFYALTAQIATLSKKLDNINVSSIQSTNTIAGNHMGVDCQMGNPFTNNSLEQANFVSNYKRQSNPYSNTYNPGWRNHPNFIWSNSQNVANPPPGFQNQQQEKKPNKEEVMAQFMAKVDARFQDHDIALKNNENTMRSIERTIGQLAKLMSKKPRRSLPSTMENNLKEQVNAITLRSGRELNVQEEEKNSRKKELTMRVVVPTSKAMVPTPVLSPTMKNLEKTSEK
ncbi:hypothetical protein F2P56_030128 [Juglans regia]|uniref:Uncharacterized protein LOC109013287 n=2 Tax=Juglans regia TaxID=51240 RepID=A0A2I4H3Y2_JUGRE|nr:uncharacterized protein LOC109013287 [Juglans regia]KAF5449711.1 hypothetical protein F2P56_030128 [Juglans regia]